MAPPGPIAMPGYHGANIRNVQIRMMVDDLLGAVQHTMFIVQFTANELTVGVSAREHFHPLEEIYYLVSGSAMASFDGDVRKSVVWGKSVSDRLDLGGRG